MQEETTAEKPEKYVSKHGTWNILHLRQKNIFSKKNLKILKLGVRASLEETVKKP